MRRACMLSAYCIQGRQILYSQGTGRVLNKVLYGGGGRVRQEVQPPTLKYTVFD